MAIYYLEWLLIGVIVGIIGNIANLQPTEWGYFGRLWLLCLSALSALLGGWLGMLLLGRYFSIIAVLCVVVMAIIIVPWLVVKICRSVRRKP